MPARRTARADTRMSVHIDESGALGEKSESGATTDHERVSTAFLAPKLTEAQFQAQVLRYAALMGWRAYHTYDSRRSAAGFPDLVLVRRPRVIWAELKSDRGRITPEQRAWIFDLRSSGQDVRIWRPSDWPEIERVLR